ncbi:hypothetical protein GY45DRAFT_254497 [Cubamyces sp. BRFM 1775]|nr:hypothetical protein GY45DRAFT_254497 [Cubamyces sp. BRFM 1775]
MPHSPAGLVSLTLASLRDSPRRGRQSCSRARAGERRTRGDQGEEVEQKKHEAASRAYVPSKKSRSSATYPPSQGVARQVRAAGAVEGAGRSIGSRDSRGNMTAEVRESGGPVKQTGVSTRLRTESTLRVQRYCYWQRGVSTWRPVSRTQKTQRGEVRGGSCT